MKKVMCAVDEDFRLDTLAEEEDNNYLINQLERGWLGVYLCWVVDVCKCCNQVIESSGDDYVGGIFAESKEEAIKQYKECINFGE